MAERIAVLSDTHGLLRPEVLDIIHGCDAIIHAGDMHTPEIMEKLSETSPHYFVRGNNDREWAAKLPMTLRFQIQELHFFMTHDSMYVPENLAGIDVVIFGHSHEYFQGEKDGRLWLNPGSCGKKRFILPLTMAVMTVEGREYNIERIDIGGNSFEY